MNPLQSNLYQSLAISNEPNPCLVCFSSVVKPSYFSNEGGRSSIKYNGRAVRIVCDANIEINHDCHAVCLNRLIRTRNVTPANYGNMGDLPLTAEEVQRLLNSDAASNARKEATCPSCNHTVESFKVVHYNDYDRNVLHPLEELPRLIKNDLATIKEGIPSNRTISEEQSVRINHRFNQNLNEEGEQYLQTRLDRILGRAHTPAVSPDEGTASNEPEPVDGEAVIDPAEQVDGAVTNQEPGATGAAADQTQQVAADYQMALTLQQDEEDADQTQQVAADYQMALTLQQDEEDAGAVEAIAAVARLIAEENARAEEAPVVPDLVEAQQALPVVPAQQQQDGGQAVAEEPGWGRWLVTNCTIL